MSFIKKWLILVSIVAFYVSSANFSFGETFGMFRKPPKRSLYAILGQAPGSSLNVQADAPLPKVEFQKPVIREKKPKELSEAGSSENTQDETSPDSSPRGVPETRTPTRGTPQTRSASTDGRNRTRNPFSYAGSFSSRMSMGMGVGMETFGDAFGAASSNRYIEFVTPGTPDVADTLSITGSGGVLDSIFEGTVTVTSGTWTWWDESSAPSSSPANDASFSGEDGIPTDTGSLPGEVTGVSFSGNGFTGTAGLTFDATYGSSSSSLSTPSISNINAGELIGLVDAYLASRYPGASISGTLASSSVNIESASTMSSEYSGVDTVTGSSDPYNDQFYHEFVGSETTSVGYEFAIPSNDFASFVYEYTATYDSPGSRTLVPAPHTTLGRVKITENMNPLPQDRLVFDYSYFHNVPLADSGIGVHRFTPGFEKTIWNGMASLELRIPMGVSLDSNIQSDGSTNTNHAEFGDLTLTYKGLLWRCRHWVVSTGLSVSIPTADDTYLYNSLTSQKLLRIKNETCHLLPFLAFQHTPNDYWFTQLYYQIDVDANGSGVYDNPELGLGKEELRYSGRIRDMTYQYLSASLGYWVYRNHCRCPRVHGLTGMNLVGEIHWTRSLDRGRAVDIRDANGTTVYRVNNGRGDCNLVNATIGTHLIFNHRTNLGIAYAVPLTSKHRQFDGELRCTLNWYF